MLVSVVIPNYNNAKWIKQCIESCLAQGDSYLKEVIVVDDHSTDQSVELIQQLAKTDDRVKLHINTKKGGNYARIYGYTHATGKYIQWLDGDDLLQPGKFRSQVEVLTQTDDVDIVFSDWEMDIYKGSELIEKKLHTEAPSEDMLYDLLIDKWKPVHGYLCTREIVDRVMRVKGWNPETPVAQDREFFTKAAILGAKFNYCPGNFCIYNRWSKTTVSEVEYRKRLRSNIQLEHNLWKLLETRDEIDKHRLRLYRGILDTHALKAIFYDWKIKLLRPVRFWWVQWSLIHWKMRFVIPFIFLIKQVQYYLTGQKDG